MWSVIDGRPRLFLLKMFAYSSATSARITKDFCVATRNLIESKARPRAGCSDNCPNVVKAIKEVVLALGPDPLRLLQLSCTIHTSILILLDLMKVDPTAHDYVFWLKGLIAFLRTSRMKASVRAVVSEKMPIILEAK